MGSSNSILFGLGDVVLIICRTVIDLITSSFQTQSTQHAQFAAVVAAQITTLCKQVIADQNALCNNTKKEWSAALKNTNTQRSKTEKAKQTYLQAAKARSDAAKLENNTPKLEAALQKAQESEKKAEEEYQKQIKADNAAQTEWEQVCIRRSREIQNQDIKRTKQIQESLANAVEAQIHSLTTVTVKVNNLVYNSCSSG